MIGYEEKRTLTGQKNKNHKPARQRGDNEAEHR